MKYFPILATSLIVAGCGGGGGSSDSESLSNTNTSTVQLTNGTFSSVANPLDVRISFAPNSVPLIEEGELQIFFDLDESGVYDDGDIAIKTGNVTGGSFVNNRDYWTEGGNFLVEYLDGGSTHAFRHPRPFNLSGPWRLVSDLGGFESVVRRVNNEVVSYDMTLRVNLDFSDGTDEANALKAALSTISASTPRMVRFTDNGSTIGSIGTDSYDYLPGENLFTTENALIISDPEGDYSGPDEFYDLLAIELIL